MTTFKKHVGAVTNITQPTTMIISTLVIVLMTFSSSALAQDCSADTLKQCKNDAATAFHDCHKTGNACQTTRDNAIANCEAQSKCAQGKLCQKGVCTPTGGTPPDGGPAACQAGLSACGGACVNLTSDSQNCGGCGTACQAGTGCSNSKCVAVVNDCAEFWACVKAGLPALVASRQQTCKELRRENAKATCNPATVGDAEAVCRHQQNFSCTATAVVLDYDIVTIMYDPPGIGSSISYGSGSTAGTLQSITESSGKNSLGASGTGSITLGGNVAGANVGFTASAMNTNGAGRDSTSSYQLSKTSTKTIGQRSVTDPIRHGQDTYELWIHPSLQYSSADSLGLNTTLQQPGPQDVIEIHVDELLGSEPVPPYKLAQFQVLTRQDIQSILSSNPFVKTVPMIDSKRYVLLAPPNSPLQLEGPDNAGDNVPLNGLVITDAGTSAQQSGETLTTVTGGSYSAGGGFIATANETLESTQLTYSDRTSFQTSTGTQQSATVTLTTSTVGYCDLIDVYEDTVFHTFLFVPEPAGCGSPSLSGRIMRHGRPAANQLVTVSLPGGMVRRVFTNANGTYRVYRLPAGQATIVAGNITVRQKIIPTKRAVHNMTITK